MSKNKDYTWAGQGVYVIVGMITELSPEWYVPNKEMVVRDDIYEGCQKIAPIHMKGVSWMQFWVTIEDFICVSEPGSMYIRLKDLW